MSALLAADLGALAERLRATTVAVHVGRGGAGSGVVWSPDGAIVTNAHVVSRPWAKVVFADGRSYEARLERRDADRDLALLRVPLEGLEAAVMRDPSDLRVGEVVVALGYPFGVPNALSMGIVHAPLGNGERRFVQADLRLAPGNSGGPLADAAGRVVGINSMVAGGLALAVPADDVQRFLGALPEPERLGVLLAAARLRDGRDVLAVVGIEPGSRAQAAGLRVGDVLPMGDVARLRFARALEVLRGGTAIVVPIPAPPETGRAA